VSRAFGVSSVCWTPVGEPKHAPFSLEGLAMEQSFQGRSADHRDGEERELPEKRAELGGCEGEAGLVEQPGASNSDLARLGRPHQADFVTFLWPSAAFSPGRTPDQRHPRRASPLPRDRPSSVREKHIRTATAGSRALGLEQGATCRVPPANEHGLSMVFQ